MKTNYKFEIESFAYIFLGGVGISLNFKNDSPNDIIIQNIAITEESYLKLKNDPDLDYGLIKSFNKTESGYSTLKISKKNIITAELEEYSIDNFLNKIHVENSQKISDIFKYLRLFSGHEAYAANMKSIIKYTNIFTNDLHTIIKIYDTDFPPFNRLEDNYLEEYNTSTNINFLFSELEKIFNSNDEKTKSIIEMYNNALLSTKIELTFILLIISLECLLLRKDEKIENSTKKTRYLSKAKIIALRVKKLVHPSEDYYDFILEMYEKRSNLTHFGNYSNITDINTLGLRRTVSRAIINYLLWMRENPDKTYNDFIDYISEDMEKDIYKLEKC